METVDVHDLKSKVGATFGPGEPFTVDQARVDVFADATDDHQWIHVDRERSKAGPFGTTIAHGYLTLSLVPGQLQGLFAVEGQKMGINYGLNRCRFPSPVLVGSQLVTTCKVASVDDVDSGLQAVFEVEIRVVGAAKPALVAEVVIRYILD